MLSSNGSFEFWDSFGNVYIASGSADLVSSNILNTVSLFGISGSAIAKPSDCITDGEIGCVATPSFKAVDMSNLTIGNIRNGISVGGITGDFPSNIYKLSGAGGNLPINSALYQARIKSDLYFEYWDAAGQRHTNNGDADIQAANLKKDVVIFGTTGTFEPPALNEWDLRAGVTVGPTTGKLRLNCRNGANLSLYDGTTGLGGAGLDYWDTIDDFSNGVGLIL